MTHTRVSLRLLIGVAVVGGIVMLSGLVWLARQQSRRARVLILTQGGASVQDRASCPHVDNPALDDPQDLVYAE
jgi:hypothetical protein